MDFKCCPTKPSTKDLKYLFCIVCFHVFHKSCAERSAFRRLEQHKIICSKACGDEVRDRDKLGSQLSSLESIIEGLKNEMAMKDSTYEKMDLDYQNEIESLRKKIDFLGNELKLKDNFLKRVERSSQKLNDEAEAIEESCNMKMGELHKTIEDLRKRLTHLREVNENLERTLRTFEEEKRKQIDELYGENQKTISRINILVSQDNENQAVIKDLHGEIEKFAKNSTVPVNRTSKGTQTSTQTMRDVSHTQYHSEKLKLHGKSTRILIISDEHGINLDRNIERHFDAKSITIQSIVKPGAHYDSVLYRLESLTRDFNGSDYVVIIAGSNDFYNNKRPKFSKIYEILKECSHTNLIFLACPILRKNNNCDYVSFFNINLKKILGAFAKKSENCCHYIDINTDRGYKVRNWLIGKMIAESIHLNSLQGELCDSLEVTKINNESTNHAVCSPINRSPQAFSRTINLDTSPALRQSVSLFEELSQSCITNNTGFNPNISHSSTFLETKLSQTKHPPPTKLNH